MSKVLDFLYEKGSQALDFFGAQSGVLPPLPSDKHWFGAKNDSNEKRRALYEYNERREANLAYEKKGQAELAQWNERKAQGKTPTYLPYDEWKKTPEASFVNSQAFNRLSASAHNAMEYRDDALYDAYLASEHYMRTDSVDELTRQFQTIMPSPKFGPIALRQFKFNSGRGSSTGLTAVYSVSVNRDIGVDHYQYSDSGYLGYRGEQVYSNSSSGLPVGQSAFFLHTHGGAEGHLSSHFKGHGGTHDNWQRWDDSKVKELAEIKDGYLACCYPSAVQGKYPFLRVANADSTHTTWSSRTTVGETFINQSWADLPEKSEAIRERKRKFAQYGYGMLDDDRNIEATLNGDKPLFIGGGSQDHDIFSSISRSIEERRTNITSQVEAEIGGTFDVETLERVKEHAVTRKLEDLEFLRELKQKAMKVIADSEYSDDPFVHRRIADSVPGFFKTPEIAARSTHYVFGRKSKVDAFFEMIEKHDKLGSKWQEGGPTAAYHRDLGAALGYNEEALDLFEFTSNKHVRELLGDNALGRLPVLSPVDAMGIDEAFLLGLSPADIHEAVYRNLKAVHGELPDSVPFPKGRDVTAAETGVTKMMKKVVDAVHGKKALGIAGLVIGLGIGLPAVASASTGTSPTDGGLGSTLAIGAGVVTIAGVGAYSYSKIRKAGINPRVAGGGAAGAAGAAGAGAAGGAAGAAAGAVNRNRGSRIYNSSFVQNELDLTTRGFFAGIGSVINDFGFNRRTGSFDTSGAPDSFIDSLFGKALKQDGYVHPVFRAEEATWKIANNLQDAYQGWKDYINTSYQNSSGIGKLFQGVRYHGFKILDSVGDGWLNKQLVKAGGFSTVIAPALMAHGALGDFKEGYRRGGLIGGALKTVTGLISGLVQNKVIAGILLNPMTGLLGAGITAAAGYAAFKIFDVRNEGANYIRSGRMGGLSWNRGPTPGMSGSMAATARQRALNSMNNSKFNAMKAMGNESYMMNVPKSRYANSTGIHGITPVLSY